MAGVLGVESVGVTDDFFALGGDSIVAISLVNHARREGLSISPREVFQLRTAEALARAEAGREVAAVDTDDIAFGAVAGTPILARISDAGDGITRFHQSVLVQTPPELDEQRTREALSAVLEAARRPASTAGSREAVDTVGAALGSLLGIRRAARRRGRGQHGSAPFRAARRRNRGSARPARS